ncbi:hypothetical protein NE237_005686 [Protea cynaroides]|uniref:Uncharacterized protein n=1 Tax=Protea cynaroides TaxID=273540 RepID=A0A9Q0KL27_9MAGN|nr:hypothetical protein NE237_005686 [Protea cynaroides]
MGVENDVDKLLHSFTRIQAVPKDADEKQIRETSVLTLVTRSKRRRKSKQLPSTLGKLPSLETLVIGEMDKDGEFEGVGCESAKRRRLETVQLYVASPVSLSWWIAQIKVVSTAPYPGYIPEEINDLELSKVDLEFGISKKDLFNATRSSKVRSTSLTCQHIGCAAQGMHLRVAPAWIACFDFSLQKMKMQICVLEKVIRGQECGGLVSFHVICLPLCARDVCREPGVMPQEF